jgi:hypothetical protein
MRYFADKSKVTVAPDQSTSQGGSAVRSDLADDLTVQQAIVLREFFELLAKWDEMRRTNGY